MYQIYNNFTHEVVETYADIYKAKAMARAKSAIDFARYSVINKRTHMVLSTYQNGLLHEWQREEN